MTFEESSRSRALLDAMGVDVIEAGFPVASRGGFRGGSRDRQTHEQAGVLGLARAAKMMSTVPPKRSDRRRRRIHLFISTSPLHMKCKLQKEPARFSKWSRHGHPSPQPTSETWNGPAEDGTRTEMTFFAAVVEAAIKAGATTINIPDTVGYAVPDEYMPYSRPCAKACRIRQAVFSVHCHDDLGMAVANSLAGVEGGARQIECAVNGIGERAGNAATGGGRDGTRRPRDDPSVSHQHRYVDVGRASKLVSAVSRFPSIQ